MIKTLMLLVVHAAVNAIANKTRESIKGCTIYTTLHPDEDCAQAIVLAGIKEVVYCMFTKDKDDDRQKKEMNDASKIFKATNIEERLVSQTKAISIKNDREIALEDNNTVVTDINKRIYIEKADSKKGDPYEAAISWEEFFMGIAILSTKRPGQYDRKQEKAVKSKTQHTHVVTTTIIII